MKGVTTILVVSIHVVSTFAEVLLNRLVLVLLCYVVALHGACSLLLPRGVVVGHLRRELTWKLSLEVLVESLYCMICYLHFGQLNDYTLFVDVATVM